MKLLIVFPFTDSLNLRTWIGLTGYSVTIVSSTKDTSIVRECESRSVKHYTKLKNALKNGSYDLILMAENQKWLLFNILRFRLKNTNFALLVNSRLDHGDNILERVGKRVKLSFLSRLVPFFITLTRQSEEYLLVKGLSKSKMKYLPLGNIGRLLVNDIGFAKKTKQKRILILSKESPLVNRVLKLLDSFQWPDTVEISLLADLGGDNSIKNRLKEIVFLDKESDGSPTLTGHYDLCICSDLYEPSYELLASLAANGTIFITGKSTANYMDILSLGINLFIFKPGDERNFLEQIKLALYFTHQGRVKAMSDEIKLYHSQEYREELLNSLVLKK